mmetsp:Transcript_24842/g.78821  ORF Transcript_24842/g.78821 Transcript_24842/m.78821 type:complete len:521 (-) Transcript_24842:86-1648(-)
MRARAWGQFAAAAAAASALEQSCPRTWVDLPPHLPSGLRDLLGEGVRKLLERTVNASSDENEPASAGVMQVYYGADLVASASAGQTDPQMPTGPPNETTVFRIGSVTKLFPVVMLYQLYERGVVQSVDDPVAKYEPGFQPINVYSRSKWTVTLRQLASQLSGLPRGAPCTPWDCNLSTPEILQRWNRTPGAIWPENTEPSYSNFAYSLLGNVLASTVGMTFPEYVRQHILDPLGMTDTGFVFSDDVVRRMAVAYADGARVPLRDLGWDDPSGQMYSSARDMAKFCHFLLGIGGDSVLDGGLRRGLLLPDFLFRDGEFLTGTPWEISFLTESRWMMLGKGGNVPGYSATINVIPPLNLSMVALWTGVLGTGAVSAELFRELLPGFLRALEPQRPQAVLPDVPAAYLGSFREDASGPADFRVVNASLPGGGWGLSLVTPRNRSLWLDFKTNSAAAMTSRSGQPVSCPTRMIGALEREWVTFSFGADGNAHAMELPGLLYGIVFRRSNDGVQAMSGRKLALRH